MSKQFAYLNQRWTSKSVIIPINKKIIVDKQKMILALHFIGQQFIIDARTNDTYTDRTGNLRSSIGYAIYDDGKEIGGKFEIAKKDVDGKGVSSAKNEARSNVSKTGLCLIVTAGMEYAAAVESKGYDVLTVYAPSQNQVKKDLEKLLKYV